MTPRLSWTLIADLAITLGLFELIPPVLGQMTVVHEPCLKLGQLRPHLPALLCKTLGFCPLLLCVLAVGRTSCCKPRQAILCFGSCGSAAVQGAASIALVRRPLAGRAFSGLGPAPLAGPIGTKLPRDTLFKVGVCHVKISSRYGVLLYPILSGVARYTCLGPRTAARAKSSKANYSQVTLIIGRQYKVPCPRPLAPYLKVRCWAKTVIHSSCSKRPL